MTNKNFYVYGGYRNILETGRKIIIEREISPNSDNLQEEIEMVLSECEEVREKTKKELMDAENVIYNELLKKLDEWQEVAEKLTILKLAKDYEENCERMDNRNTTQNKWIESKHYDTIYFEISNNVYNFNIRVYESTTYKDGKDIPEEWWVSYTLCYNIGKSKIITRLDRKKFKNKDKAYQYIEGRKKHFSKYFTEMFPPIPKEDAHNFMCNGKLLKGYIIQE